MVCEEKGLVGKTPPKNSQVSVDASLVSFSSGNTESFYRMQVRAQPHKAASTSDISKYAIFNPNTEEHCLFLPTSECFKH